MDFFSQTNASNLSPSKTPAPTPSNISNQVEDISRTKQVFERLFPDIPSGVEYDTWLNTVSSHIENLQQQQLTTQANQQNSTKRKAAATIDANNHQNGDDEDSSSEENITGNGTHHYKQDNGVKLSPSTEELVLQNAQLKTTVDEYKLIVADTVSIV